MFPALLYTKSATLCVLSSFQVGRTCVDPCCLSLNAQRRCGILLTRGPLRSLDWGGRRLVASSGALARKVSAMVTVYLPPLFRSLALFLILPLAKEVSARVSEA